MKTTNETVSEITKTAEKFIEEAKKNHRIIEKRFDTCTKEHESTQAYNLLCIQEKELILKLINKDKNKPIIKKKDFVNYTKSLDKVEKKKNLLYKKILALRKKRKDMEVEIDKQIEFIKELNLNFYIVHQALVISMAIANHPLVNEENNE